MSENLERLHHFVDQAKSEMAKVMIGQEGVIDFSLITILTGQHALIEGVPGVGKTLLVNTLGKVLGCECNRIQFTPDLMPGDITGTNVFDLKENEFNLFKGPIFTTFLLGDEINRAPPKTQSAMLQAMQERKVTIDRQTYPLSPDFTVFATQNPIEYEGTYPLPEAQKDRFMFKIIMKPLDQQQELNLAKRMLGHESPEDTLASHVVQPILKEGELSELKRVLEEVEIRDELLSYIVDLIRETRQTEMLLSGAGPRATQYMVLASRVAAVLEHRNFVTPDDIKRLAHPILDHRLVVRPEFEVEGATEAEIISKIMSSVPIPR